MRGLPVAGPIVAATLLVASLVARSTVDAQSAGQAPVTAASSPVAKFYKAWTVDELLPSVRDLGTGRDWAQGRELFKKAACGGCHAFGTEWEGSGLAPDLTAVGSKYTRDFILQSIIEPSATLNGQYFHTSFTLKNGDVITGSIIDVVAKTIVIAPVMLAPQSTIEVAEGDVKSEEPSPVSPMPPGLLNEFTREQIVELMAFLDAGGDRNAPVYRKR